MKVRNGYVSNSSSSSYVVIKGRPNIVEFPKEMVIGENGGECHFGWQVEDYYDFESKVNWAFLQSLHSSEGKEFFTELMKEKGIKIHLPEFDEYGDPIDMYIDHQSYGDENLNIFESKGVLEVFLFSNESYIHNDNDNH